MSSTPSTNNRQYPDAREAATSFVSWLVGLSEGRNRGALATLRRGAGVVRDEAIQLHPLVIPRIRRGATTWQRDVYYMIASAYAMHPANTTAGDLGAHLRRTQATNSEQHLQALLRAERSDLVRLLPRVILLLKSKSVGVNYAQLMRDLWFWGGQQKFAQSRWATSFWSEWQLAEAVDESADPTGMLPDAAEAEVE